MKLSHIPSSGTDNDNYPLFAEALENTNHNTYSYPASPDWYMQSEDGEPSRFEQFLTSIKDTEIKVIASLSAPHFASSSDDYWVKTLYPECNAGHDDYVYEECFGQWNATAHVRWIESYKLAVRTLSLMKKDYPNLIGFQIDDFGLYLCTVENEIYSHKRSTCFTEETLSAIKASKVSKNFLFFPTMYFSNNIPRTLLPGYNIGKKYGTIMNNDESIEIKIRFRSRARPRDTYRLSFFFNDTYNDESTACEEGVYIKTKVNGRTFLKQSINGNSYIEMFNEDITPAIKTDSRKQKTSCW